MKKKVKKIIAREFLVFIGTFIFVIVVSFFLKSLSEYSDDKIKKLELSQFRLSARTTDLYVLAKKGVFNSKEDFVHYVNNNSIEDCYSIINDEAFSSLSEFKESVSDYAIEHNSKESKKILLIEKEIKAIKKSFYSNLKDDFLLPIALVFFSISFIIRYLYYAVKWSMKTLKEDN